MKDFETSNRISDENLTKWRNTYKHPLILPLHLREGQEQHGYGQGLSISKLSSDFGQSSLDDLTNGNKVASTLENLKKDNIIEDELDENERDLELGIIGNPDDKTLNI
jgi:hypothetical protein